MDADQGSEVRRFPSVISSLITWSRGRDHVTSLPGEWLNIFLNVAFYESQFQLWIRKEGGSRVEVVVKKEGMRTYAQTGLAEGQDAHP